MIRPGQKNRLRNWLIRVLLLAMVIPGSSAVLAMPDPQAGSNDVSPCHQSQSHHQQTASESDTGHSCCDSLHQCGGNCDHGCKDCFSTGHAPCLISSSAELQHTDKIYLLPVSVINNGVISPLLLRPPRHIS